MKETDQEPVAQVSAQTLAVVDLGSNSFRLEIGVAHGKQIRVLETLRDMLRLASGLDKKKQITKRARQNALICLSRFGERLQNFQPKQVRAVATNTFRVATNALDFLPEAEMALGFPIEIISGHEEARLIFLGTSYCLPRSSAQRLIIDIGGGSTEFAIGRGHDSQQLESLKLGCVNVSEKFFKGGDLNANNFRHAETYARAEIESIAGDFDRRFWQEAYASSGSAQALAEILKFNNFAKDGITSDGLAALQRHLISKKHTRNLKLVALKQERVPVLAGGLVIMRAALEELNIPIIHPVGGALRLGALYDLLGRRHDQDSRAVTVEQWMERHRLDQSHAQRVAELATRLYQQLIPNADPADIQLLRWAALLHNIGVSISHIGFHKHSAYMLENGDMPGFSSFEQKHLGALTLNCRGDLSKARKLLPDLNIRAQILALRIALIFYRGHRQIDLPKIGFAFTKKSIRFMIKQDWLADHPLTEFLLDKEAKEWKKEGFSWRYASDNRDIAP
ncbi:MAG: Ppx/GppA family phosphatase [Burkholderiales bacterium]|jgi:exopolyphosphatase/guanosine-5'-triphosphate,3'-diphosphate pyrophosphatase|nr:Ppx/GppA family phosphatase [Burkholderiales bacterium]